MGGINVGRWLGGGVAAGVLMWVCEGLGSLLYAERMEAAMAAHGLAFEETAGMLITGLAISLVVGLTIVFFYAAVRDRFGPGPKTALLVAFALWIGGYVVSLVGYAMLGLFPADLLVTWALIGLIEMILAGLLGGWIYRESSGVSGA